LAGSLGEVYRRGGLSIALLTVQISKGAALPLFQFGGRRKADNRKRAQTFHEFLFFNANSTKKTDVGRNSLL